MAWRLGSPRGRRDPTAVHALLGPDAYQEAQDIGVQAVRPGRPDQGNGLLECERLIGRRFAACGDRQRNRSVVNSNYPLTVANSSGGDTL